MLLARDCWHVDAGFGSHLRMVHSFVRQLRHLVIYSTWQRKCICRPSLIAGHPNNSQNSFTLCRTRIICESVQPDNPRSSATFRCILIKFANSYLWISGPPSVPSAARQSIRNIAYYFNWQQKKEIVNDTLCTLINILVVEDTIIILWSVLCESFCSCWPNESDAQLTIKQPHQRKTMENGPSDLCPGQVWHDIHSTHLSIDLSSQSTTTNTWGMSFRFHRLKKLPINPNFTAATWSRHI